MTCIDGKYCDSKCGLQKVREREGKGDGASAIIRSLRDALLFFENTTKNAETYVARRTMFYRGQSSSDYELQASVYRKNSEGSKAVFATQEERFYREMLSRHPDAFSQCKTTIEKLAIMQHHYMPTRLLDITENPLVALFFACQENVKTDIRQEGIIFSFAVNSDRIKHVDSDTVSVLSNIARMPYGFDIEKNEDVKKLYHMIRDEKPHFQEIIKDEHKDNYVVCVKSQLNSARIKAQQGAFLLFGIRKKKSKPSNFWNKEGSTISEEAIYLEFACIPKDSKKGILRELDQIGIREATLFPSMDSTASYLKKSLYE